MAGFGRNRTKANPDIPVVAMADIAFLLIIFFLVTTQLERLKVTPLDLPSSRKTEEQEKLKNIQVNLKGRVAYVGERRYALPEQLKQLADFLSKRIAALKKQEDKVVIVQSDLTVKWEIYVNVLETIKASGGVPAIQTEEIVTVRK